ncbi:histone deacetylase 4 isoform X2 [Malaya genurostris]|uniref:histone deacetylase 4 isoform X2 n=1 Tax=Malaya genurostris TaxID=325434 RepID=UPI0026F38FE4|nr:histone deacetylase 4 isoform X2 [Malaya genurostris]XP_058443457.1 histone deacetylase 4 isoform X2 [Malaya genurostris]XP_058443458.1 histone deacetylase 4 isoform X2 [Malaya genurostris]
MHVLKLEMARDSTMGRDRVLVMPSTGIALDTPSTSQPAAGPNDINQQILELRKEQEIQKQKLWHAFQEKNKELEMQHRQQLEHKFQLAAYHTTGYIFQELRDQRLAEEAAQQRERREREAMKRKEKQDFSANASSEVKQKLQTFLIKKQAAASNGMSSPSSYRNWGVVKSSSGESIPAGAVASSSHPYKIPPPPPSSIAKYDSDFPLRKTASESNLLKIRIKQRVIEKRTMTGPLAARRQERLQQAAQRRLQKQSQVQQQHAQQHQQAQHSQQLSHHQISSMAAHPANCSTGTPDSGPNSPPALGSRGSPSNAPIQEENEDPQYRSSINDLALFSSPSMPNISLGRPHLADAHPGNHLTMVPLRPPHQMVAAGQPPQPSLSHHPPPLPPHFVNHPTMLELTEQQLQAAAAAVAAAGGLSINPTHLGGINSGVPPVYGQPITDAQVAQARLHKQGHRPLGRTQSAPLPLGHPMLTGTSGSVVNIGQTHYEDSDAERQAYEQHLLMKQKIRQTALSRANCVREPELKEEVESGEVIDLTDKKQPPKTTVITANSVIKSTSHTTLLCDSAESLQQQHVEFLQAQQREFMRQSIQLGILEDPYNRTILRPLSRTSSSPLVHLGTPASSNHPMTLSDTGQEDTPPPVNLTVQNRSRSMLSYTNEGLASPGPLQLTTSSSASAIPLRSVQQNGKLTTGLAFDSLMLKHSCICGDNAAHPEHSGRLQSVWARLVETGLASRCDKLRSRKATQEELQTVHTEAHSLVFGTNQINRQKLDASRVSFVRLACGGVGVDLDTTWNEHHTAAAARMAAGCVIDLSYKVAKSEIRNAFAVVRPPGHHAEPNAAMGFCFFNSIAIAAKLLLQRLPSEMRRILIVDWDVHHGNGTQQVFYDDPNVLYLSIHRHDDGNFFPGTGGPTECGAGPGLGFNVNIPWSGGLNPPLGDAEYLAAFRTVVMPIARDFQPDIVLVSAGFDAAYGHPAPLGGYMVSPACFGYLTRELMKLADGKVVLALEGGYDLPAICDSAQECVRALLGDELSPIVTTELSRPPCLSAIETLQKTIAIQMSHWPCVKRLAHTVSLSAMQAVSGNDREESDTVTAMAGLSMQPPNRTSDISREDSEEPMDQDESK